MTKVQGDWLQRSETQAVLAAISNGGGRAYFVGGCVRNALFDMAVNDVDIATDVRPDQVIARVQAAGLKAIPTGIDHGTVTVVSGGIPHEVTTFRKDVETDGRRAVVAYSDTIADDARRRDFTMNALYADANGRVIDPLGGLEDLLARRVRFIEDADARIKEDYLRSLRFFRFYAWYGDASRGLDADGLAAIASNLAGLETLSPERVGAEVLKLLAAPDPAPAVAAMKHTGVLQVILPGADDQALAPLVHLENGDAPDPIRRLAVLGGEDFDQRLRLSRAQARQLDLLRAAAGNMQSGGELGYRHGAKAAMDILRVRAASLGMPLPVGAIQAAELGAKKAFPIKAADLMPALQGPELGLRLRELEDRWIHSDFELTRSQLLA